MEESINMDKQIIKEDIHQIDKNSKKKEYYELGKKEYYELGEKVLDSDDIKFIKPKLLDRDIAVPESNIVKIIELLQFNESPEEYALMCDKDSVYF
ncbi:unnamed protein product [Parnassius apollo]|uniref:(apollo) hypothetical protein n=1 Tax=Parnassius apollo TaxID=110799 RepID=A0A8S3W091_PARAO|nr:unnamed protein product [Parnassius apollo]